ncbi:MAG: hypothetical protein QW292_14030 [Candidatus Parvarchaeota archaeon]
MTEAKEIIIKQPNTGILHSKMLGLTEDDTKQHNYIILKEQG